MPLRRPAIAGARRRLLIQLLVVFPGDQGDFCPLERILCRLAGLSVLSTNMFTVSPLVTISKAAVIAFHLPNSSDGMSHLGTFPSVVKCFGPGNDSAKSD